METKHTKGQWFACKITNTTNYSVRTNERPELVITPVNLTEVNETIHNDLIGEAIANAKLIAAAPDMLIALQKAVEVIERMSDEYSAIANRHASYTVGESKIIEGAIKKATE